MGRFQAVAYFMCLICVITEGFLLYNVAFLTLEPTYQCVDLKGGAT